MSNPFSKKGAVKAPDPERLQPNYTPPRIGEGSAVVVSDREKIIVDATGKESGHVVGSFVDPETGLVKEVQVPRLPYEKWIDPAGNVVSLPVRNNRVWKSTENPYTSWIKNKKARKGWVPYDSQASGLTAEAREELIKARKDQRKLEAETYNKAFKAQEERLAEALKRGNQEALQDIVNTMVAAVSGGKGKRTPVGE